MAHDLSRLFDLSIGLGKMLQEHNVAMAVQIREQFQSIWINLPKLAPLWDDLIQALDGDYQAAGRLGARIPWQPKPLYREAIRLRARSQGSSPKDIYREALTQGVILALSSDENNTVPLLVKPQSAWVYTAEETLDSVCPYELDMHFFWDWVKEEACRAAELWLVGQSYAPTVVLAEPPTVDWDLRLFRFTSDSADKPGNIKLGGRPFGSTVFENQAAFLQEIRLAVAEVRNRGNRVTQERVAEVLSRKSFTSSGDPGRQLRFWVREFGFKGWQDLIQRI